MANLGFSSVFVKVCLRTDRAETIHASHNDKIIWVSQIKLCNVTIQIGEEFEVFISVNSEPC